MRYPVEASEGESSVALRAVADDANAALLRQRWTGNVRELGRVLKDAGYKCRGNEIKAADLNLSWQGQEPESETRH
jgi:DNA-binding NtrC family response regulator